MGIGRVIVTVQICCIDSCDGNKSITDSSYSFGITQNLRDIVVDRRIR